MWTLVALLALGCGETSTRTPAAQAGNDPVTPPPATEAAGTTPPDDEGSRPDAALPPHTAATPTTLAIVNRRTTPIVLVTSATTFRLERDDSEPRFVIGAAGPLVASDSCACRCGFGCLQCEPPLYEERTLEPGGRYEHPWSGRIRLYQNGCFEPYALPPGPRRLTACLRGVSAPNADCVTVEATFPTDQVELAFE